MADQSFLPTVPNTPLPNKRRTDEDMNTLDTTRLPSGACNYTNLSAAGAGGSAPRCGCRRFWDKSLAYGDGGGVGVKSGFCMCEHHACFHDHEPEGSYKGNASSDVRAIEGASSTPIQSATQQLAQKIGRLATDPLTDGNDIGRHLQESEIPDTLQWSRFLHSGSPDVMPAIPSQCLLPSETGSGTSGSQARYYRPFGGRGLDTLNHISKPSLGNATKPKGGQPLTENSRALQIYEDANGNGYVQSLTEVATPSARASQDPDAAAEFNKNITSVQNALEKLVEEHPQSVNSFNAGLKRTSNSMMTKQATSSIANDPDESMIPKLRSIINHMANYPTAIKNHERRLDLLENTSFSNAAVEELQDSHNLMDIRVLEIEGRMEEIEKVQAAQTDVSSIGSQHNVESSIDSRLSTTSSAMIAGAMDQINPSRVDALEEQVAELQASALPSHARPWEVEIVFLPFGSHLMGIWSSQHTMSQRPRGNSTGADNWTQTQNNSLAAAQANLTAHDQIPAWERSASDLATDKDSTWLMAKACGRQSRVDERLRSRGLVKTVQIYSPDARDVQAAMVAAFGELPGILSADPYTQHEDENADSIPKPLLQYLGLQASWIPLRKLHKDSCLRFLNTSEMLTPALWTVPFLASSVAMRTSGVRRLYVTQRDSYIQHLSNDTADWTWQKLRQLPRVYPDQPSFDQTPEADAHEPCWEFDERFDTPPQSVHASFESHVSALSIRSVPPAEPASLSDHFSSEAISRNSSTTPTSVAPPPARPLSPLKERNPFRPIHTRTTSMPSFIPIKGSSSQTSKRRIASFDLETQSSPTRAASSSTLNLTLKRRRISRSPSRPRDTPRWSIGPPSPYTFNEDITERNKRNTTPFAYATPHSNAPYIEARPRSGADIDIYQDEEDDDQVPGSATNESEPAADGSGSWQEQNALSDYESDEPEDQARQLEEEWQGVQDEVYESRSAGDFPVGKIGNDLRQEEKVDDSQSDASSQPSEYPSTQQGLYSPRTKAEFKIHVDEEAA